MKAPVLKGRIAGFNYAVLEPDVRQSVQEHARAVHSLLSRTAEGKPAA